MPLLRFLVILVLAVAASPTAENLRIYVIDVEGGQATLIVSPSGESMLVDAGWPGHGGRDADRIVETAKRAGVSRIDYLLVTHYHADHVGGVPAVAARMPVGTYVDHGENTETEKPKSVALAKAYYRVRQQAKHLVVKPGDTIPLAGVEVRVVSSNGAVLDRPLPGAGQKNAWCATATRKPADHSENGRSAGFLLTYGNFRFVDLGDLTWNYELELACPVNKIGTVEVYLTTHHGLAQSGSPALVGAMAPRVAIMNNGARKGGAPAAWRVVAASPRLERFWQLHYAVAAGEEANAPARYIANAGGEDRAHGIHLTAKADGSFTVENERNGYREEYPAAR